MAAVGRLFLSRRIAKRELPDSAARDEVVASWRKAVFDKLPAMGIAVPQSRPVVMPFVRRPPNDDRSGQRLPSRGHAMNQVKSTPSRFLSDEDLDLASLSDREFYRMSIQALRTLQCSN